MKNASRPCDSSSMQMRGIRCHRRTTSSHTSDRDFIGPPSSVTRALGGVSCQIRKVYKVPTGLRVSIRCDISAIRGEACAPEARQIRCPPAWATQAKVYRMFSNSPSIVQSRILFGHHPILRPSWLCRTTCLLWILFTLWANAPEHHMEFQGFVHTPIPAARSLICRFNANVRQSLYSQISSIRCCVQLVTRPVMLQVRLEFRRAYTAIVGDRSQIPESFANV